MRQKTIFKVLFFSLLMTLLLSCREDRSNHCCIGFKFKKQSFCIYFDKPWIEDEIERVFFSRTYLIDPEVDSGVFSLKTFLWQVSNSIYILDNCLLLENEEIDSLVFLNRLVERYYFNLDSTVNISRMDINDRINLIMYEQLDKSYIQPKMVQFYHYIISLDDCLSLYISLKQHKGEDYHENFEDMVKNLVIERGACRRCLKGCYTTFHPLLEETVDCN